MGNFWRVFSKIEKKKRKAKQQNTKRLSFMTQFKTEILQPFTGCRKVLGKMPGQRLQFEGLQRVYLSS